MKQPGTRHKARRRAVDLLFEAEAKQVSPAQLVAERGLLRHELLLHRRLLRAQLLLHGLARRAASLARLERAVAHSLDVAGQWRMHPVSTDVGSVRSQGAHLVEPVQTLL